MALTAIGASILVPSLPLGTAGADATVTLDATTDYVCFVTKAPATGTIDKAYIRLGSTTLSGTLSCQIQTLDASGDPSGTAYGSCAQSDVAVTGTEDNTNITFASLACSATKGDWIAVRIWASTVTSGSVNVTVLQAIGAGTPAINNPYSTARTTGTGAGTHASTAGGVSIEYSGAVFYDVGFLPSCTLAAAISIDADGSIRRAGNVVTPPVRMVSSGAWGIFEYDNDTTSIKLYDTDGTTVLATSSLLTAHRGTLFSGVTYAPWDGSAVTLTAGSTYRVVVETTSTLSSGAVLRTIDSIPAAGHMAQLGLGTACYYTQHNGSAWAETTTRRAQIGLLVSQLDDGRGLGRAGYLLGMN